MRAALTLLIACLLAFSAQAQNIEGSLLTSSARSATANSTDRDNPSWRGVKVVINMTAYSAGTWTPRIQGKDVLSGQYYDILVGPAVTSTPGSPIVMRVYPGITPSAADSDNPTFGAAASDALPRTWRFQMTGASTPSGTFSAGFTLQQ